MIIPAARKNQGQRQQAPAQASRPGCSENMNITQPSAVSGVPLDGDLEWLAIDIEDEDRVLRRATASPCCAQCGPSVSEEQGRGLYRHAHCCCNSDLTVRTIVSGLAFRWGNGRYAVQSSTIRKSRPLCSASRRIIAAEAYDSTM